MNHPSQIQCPKCDGTGRVTLPGILAEVLEAVRKFPQSSPPQLWAFLGYKKSKAIEVTAINQRLKSLMALGLVSRTRKSHSWVYVCARMRR